MQQVNPIDPAPSRLSYRMQRLWLTPMVRLVVLVGLPMSASLGIGYLVVAHTSAVENVHAYAMDVRRTIEQRPEFMVKMMAIDGGTDEVSEDIREILPIDFPVSSFDLNLEDMRIRIEELDAVASASLRVRSGGILQVDLVERTAAVVWRGPQGLELLDQNGNRVAALGARSDRPELPLIVGEGAETSVEEALELFAEAGPLSDRLRGLARIGERRWNLVLDKDQVVYLPEQDAVSALQRVAAMEQAMHLFARDISVVDLRDPERLTVRKRDINEAALLRRISE